MSCVKTAVPIVAAGIRPTALHWRRFVREMGWAERRPLLMAASVAIQQGYRPADVAAVGRSLVDTAMQLIMRDGAVCFSSGNFARGAPAA